MDPITPTAAPTALNRPALRPPPDQAPGPAAAPARGPNPSLRLDPTLNLVVLEFRGPGGEVVRSTPTPEELRAYRTAQLRGEPWGDAARRAPPVTPGG